jgi:hypothetical protein
MGVKGMASLAAGLQLARRGFDTSSEAATGMQRLMEGLTSRKAMARLKELGIAVTGDDGQLRSLPDLMRDIAANEKAMKVGGLNSIFESAPARMAFEQIMKTRGEWEDLTAATMNANDVQEDFVKRSQSDSFKLQKFWNDFKVSVRAAFVVVVDAFAWLTGHAEGVGVAVAALALAFMALKAEAVVAGMATAAAWLAALAPILGLALLIGAAILVIEDLYSWITGGESVFKDAFSEWGRLFDAHVKKPIGRMIDWLMAKIDALTEKFKTPLRMAKGAIGAVLPGGVGGGVAGLDGIKGIIARRDAELAASAAGGTAFMTPEPRVMAGMERPRGSTTINAPMTVNIPPGANAEEIAALVQKSVTATMEGVARDMETVGRVP